MLQLKIQVKVAMDTLQDEAYDDNSINKFHNEKRTAKSDLPWKAWKLPSIKKSIQDIRLPKNLLVEDSDDKKDHLKAEEQMKPLELQSSKKFTLNSVRNFNTPVHEHVQCFRYEDDLIQDDDMDKMSPYLSFGRGRRFRVHSPESTIQTTAHLETSKVAESFRSAYPTFQANEKKSCANSGKKSSPNFQYDFAENKSHNSGPVNTSDSGRSYSSLRHQSVDNIIEDYYGVSRPRNLHIHEIQNSQKEKFVLTSDSFPPLGSSTCKPSNSMHKASNFTSDTFPNLNEQDKLSENKKKVRKFKGIELPKHSFTKTRETSHTKESSCESRYISKNNNWTNANAFEDEPFVPSKKSTDFKIINSNMSSIRTAPDGNIENENLNSNLSPVLMKLAINCLPLSVSKDFIHDFLISYGDVKSLYLVEKYISVDAHVEMWIDEANKNALMEFMNSRSIRDIFDFPDGGPELNVVCKLVQ